MKTFRKLQSHGSKDSVVTHYGTVVSSVRRILGKPSIAASAASFHSQDDFARAYLSHSLTRKAASINLMSPDEVKEIRELEDHLSASQPELFRQLGLQKTAAYMAFTTREELNHHINETDVFGWSHGDGEHHTDDSVGMNVLLRAKDIVSDILGLCDVDFICRKANFGNGASAFLKRTEAQREKKYVSSLSGTCGILPLADIVLAGSPVWNDVVIPKGCIYINQRGKALTPPGFLKRTPGAVLDFVPKDAGIDRIIMKEPELNGYFQKGLGSLMRKRLRSWRLSRKLILDGIDLNTSGDLNKELAQAGSKQGHIGTVDAKQASDSIALALGEFLLPPDWFNIICTLRSPYVEGPHGYRKLGMIGGMGNGFTFELESILFYAIGVAAAERSSFPFAEVYVSIHGDDLTVPSDVINEVTAAYTRAGIVVNVTKSFSQGPFRESCGGHFFNGQSVKPFYVKKSDGSKRGDWFWLANSLLNWLSERSEDFIHSHRGRDLLEIILHLRQYASSGEPAKWSIGTERGSRTGLYGLVPYKMRGAWPYGRIVTPLLKQETLPEDGKYLCWLQQPTRLPTLHELCSHLDSTPLGYASSDEGKEVERWTRLTTFTPLRIPSVVAPLWQLCRDHNLQDF